MPAPNTKPAATRATVVGDRTPHVMTPSVAAVGSVFAVASSAALGVSQVRGSDSASVICSSRSRGLRYVNGNPTSTTPPTTFPMVL
jgi:hypothetical protein